MFPYILAIAIIFIDTLRWTLYIVNDTASNNTTILPVHTTSIVIVHTTVQDRLIMATGSIALYQYHVFDTLIFCVEITLAQTSKLCQ